MAAVVPSEQAKVRPLGGALQGAMEVPDGERRSVLLTEDQAPRRDPLARLEVGLHVAHERHEAGIAALRRGRDPVRRGLRERQELLACPRRSTSARATPLPSLPLAVFEGTEHLILNTQPLLVAPRVAEWLGRRVSQRP